MFTSTQGYQTTILNTLVPCLRQNHDKKEIKARFYCILLYEFILSKERNLFLLGLHANIHLRQILVNLKDSAQACTVHCSYFYSSIIQKRAKKLVFRVFYCINSYLARWKIFFALYARRYSLRGFPCQVWGHCCNFWMNTIKKGRKKLILVHFDPIYAPWKGDRLNSNSLMG